ncbi:unnamed protein product, partial [Scytosiphon promiscuus]
MNDPPFFLWPALFLLLMLHRVADCWMRHKCPCRQACGLACDEHKHLVISFMASFQRSVGCRTLSPYLSAFTSEQNASYTWWGSYSRQPSTRQAYACVNTIHQTTSCTAGWHLPASSGTFLKLRAHDRRTTSAAQSLTPRPNPAFRRP